MHAVGECVWAHYLAVTERAGRGGAFSLSAAQRQEVWVQLSALQIALQVSCLFQASVSVVDNNMKLIHPDLPHVFPQAYHQSLKKHPSDTSVSGLSRTRLFLTSFSQVPFFCY